MDGQEQVGQKVTLTDGKQRILRQDEKGLYVRNGSVKSYVVYHKYTERWKQTGDWGHLQ